MKFTYIESEEERKALLDKRVICRKSAGLFNQILPGLETEDDQEVYFGIITRAEKSFFTLGTSFGSVKCLYDQIIEVLEDNSNEEK